MTWPLVARAQPPTIPMVGFVSSLRASDQSRILPAFRQGLSEAGHVEDRSVAIEYRWAEGHYARLPALVADLVSRRVVVIAALSGTPTGLAAKAATATIPIVFAIGGDPVAQGLVTSLSRPPGNVTGVTFFTAQLGPKRLELLRELVPKSGTVALLVNQSNPTSVLEATGIQEAAQAIGLPTRIYDVRTEGDIDRAFVAMAQRRIRALVVGADPFFLNERDKLVAVAAHHAIPAIYADRELTEAGGLISYGARRADAYRQAGIYVGRLLNGEKPANLPVVLPTKFELVINLKTAKTLGLTIPQPVRLRADHIIE